MKTLAVLALLFPLSAWCDGFITMPGETNSIQIAKGEAVVITSVFDSGVQWPDYVLDGVSRPLGWRPGAIFIGPGQIITTNRGIVSFSRFSAPYLKPLIWTNYWTNNIKFNVSVPVGKTFRLLGALDNNPVNVFAARPGSTNLVNLLAVAVNPAFDPAQAVDLPGPIELELSTPSANAFRLCYFLEDAAEPTAAGELLGPGGSYQVIVEKSLDLKSWHPLMLKTSEDSDARAFYRLGISK